MERARLRGHGCATGPPGAAREQRVALDRESRQRERGAAGLLRRVRIEPVLGRPCARHRQRRSRNTRRAHRPTPARPCLRRPGRRLLRAPAGRPRSTMRVLFSCTATEATLRRSCRSRVRLPTWATTSLSRRRPLSKCACSRTASRRCLLASARHRSGAACGSTAHGFRRCPLRSALRSRTPCASRRSMRPRSSRTAACRRGLAPRPPRA